MGTYATADEQGIKKVFEQLTEAGVLAKAKHECCMSCAVASLSGATEGTDYHGFAYYHEQDDDSVREGGDLYIGFSSAKADDEPGTVAVGQQVVKALEAADFVVEWDGSSASRIRVKELYFEEHEKCDTCYERVENCQCCWTCDCYPCECCDKCGGPDCRCDERCDECGELPEDCCCHSDEE